LAFGASFALPFAGGLAGAFDLELFFEVAKIRELGSRRNPPSEGGAAGKPSRSQGHDARNGVREHSLRPGWGRDSSRRIRERQRRTKRSRGLEYLA
jgi:hypothetical protein